MSLRTVQLSNGIAMPVLGVGTWQVKDARVLHDVIDRALQLGVRLIDTAAVYGNESQIGDALKVLLPKHSLQRSDIFITSKLQPSDQGNAEEAVRNSLTKLQTEYLDLYLVHWPGTAKTDVNDAINLQNRHNSWQQLEKCVDSGQLRCIGVSNFLVRHIDQLLNVARIKPAVNQFEFHVYFADHDLVQHCTQLGVHCQAYSSLGSHSAGGALLNDPVVQSISNRVKCTNAQLLLAWALHHKLTVLPRTTKPERIEENCACLQVKLSDDHMKQLDALNQQKKYCWDPTNIA